MRLALKANGPSGCTITVKSHDARVEGPIHSESYLNGDCRQVRRVDIIDDVRSCISPTRAFGGNQKKHQDADAEDPDSCIRYQQIGTVRLESKPPDESGGFRCPLILSRSFGPALVDISRANNMTRERLRTRIKAIDSLTSRGTFHHRTSQSQQSKRQPENVGTLRPEVATPTRKHVTAILPQCRHPHRRALSATAPGKSSRFNNL
jgi:hypothetical protein